MLSKCDMRFLHGFAVRHGLIIMCCCCCRQTSLDLPERNSRLAELQLMHKQNSLDRSSIVSGSSIYATAMSLSSAAQNDESKHLIEDMIIICSLMKCYISLAKRNSDRSLSQMNSLLIYGQ